MNDDGHLSEEQLAGLTEEQLVQYFTLLERLDDLWELHPKQQEAEHLASQVDELMYGGAAGGGKSDWLCWHMYQLSTRHKGHSTLALRRTFPQLKDSLIRRSLEKFVDPDVCNYVVGEREWRFKETGSTIRFGFCDTEEDVRHYLSTEYDLIAFEELTEFTQRQYMLVRSRNRTTAAKRARGIRPHTISATNPGQVGHVWVKDRFVEPTGYGQHPSTQIVEAFGKKKEVTVAFVPAKVTDNPSIDPDYVFNLAALPETEKRQYLYGDWDVFEGQFFTEYDRDTHVIDPFPIPESWPKFRAIDYGTAKPWCCLWLAFDNDGNCYVYRELYGPDLTASEQAKAAVAASFTVDPETGVRRPEKIHSTLADPSIWSRQGHGVSIAQMYRDSGLTAKKAKNARRDGWSRVRDYFRGDGTGEGGPFMRIFSTCENLARTIPIQMHDKKDPEDLNTKLEDHALDALRYGLMARAPHRRRQAPIPVGPDQAPDLDEIVRERGIARGQHPILGRVSI